MKAAKKLKIAPRPFEGKTERKEPTPSKDRFFQIERHLRHFCNVTSHELSNTIGAILGELEFGSQSKNEEERLRSTQIAIKAVEKALHLTTNLRYFAVQTQVNLRVSDLSQLILDTVDTVETEFKKQQIHFAVYVDASVFVLMDESAIQHVLLNLLWNAAHSMPRGGKLTLSLQTKKNTAEICVSDTGEGISSKNIERIFEPYVSREGVTGTESGGLGLSVAKTLIECHGGEIAVRSEVGKGTNFFIELPFSEENRNLIPHHEKRRFRRVRVTLPAELTLENGQKFLSFVTVLSTGGCYLSLTDTQKNQYPKLGSTVSLKISHFDGEEIEIKKARVATAFPHHHDPGVGIEFLDMGEKARLILKAFVKSHPSHG